MNSNANSERCEPYRMRASSFLSTRQFLKPAMLPFLTELKFIAFSGEFWSDVPNHTPSSIGTSTALHVYGIVMSIARRYVSRLRILVPLVPSQPSPSSLSNSIKLFIVCRSCCTSSLMLKTAITYDSVTSCNSLISTCTLIQIQTTMTLPIRIAMFSKNYIYCITFKPNS